MTIYMAFLRGINVSGHNMIKMSELKTMFEALGFGRVQTYINSGNVLFESEEGVETLQLRIENEIKTVFGFTISVMLRTDKELQQIIENSPFVPDSLSDGESIHLILLKEAPTQEELDRLPDVDYENDEYYIEGREIYVLYRKSLLDSKLPKKFQKLVPQTARNWKTIIKLSTMVKAMKAH
ncbi:DUF1697 domain-containing protein [Paenibacillus radicis (ex Xue et al. 2023)]|uniref:DUF1697 domain-containing protein n=1 Tax=Paenibacillus radicis (ex Xue et al. 2023) TaxID=2972489 RepID=A0ABT1YMZ6_9BACL|nr:DUF1697 domain-containing protein [Paenibacillus radicis (ex Xue et al. 2023)]MCR8634553.1 DUF1697 domain-containing protein [Paenibacillus radicis (ex Xue et al. 2023)]